MPFCGYCLQEQRVVICPLGNWNILQALVTGGQIHDSECATELLSKVNLEGKTVLGDKAFCSVHIRDFIQTQGGAVCIPDKANSLKKHEFDRALYKVRNVVERFFLRIKNRRRVATRYDKLALCFLNFILLSATSSLAFTNNP